VYPFAVVSSLLRSAYTACVAAFGVYEEVCSDSFSVTGVDRSTPRPTFSFHALKKLAEEAMV
jgi:hypothetical protein